MKPRILIVDDDPGTLASLSRAFALEGYEALTAASGARALERLPSEPVDAILSDVVMPGMDGLEFLARLQRDGARRAGDPDERPGHASRPRSRPRGWARSTSSRSRSASTACC